ncbi:MAG: EAL domain-containing protein [Clostridia bacterium]|nr:EAL domain-containing protein [Clostridia bacterium]
MLQKLKYAFFVIFLFSLFAQNAYAEPREVRFQVESNYPPFKFIQNGYLTGFDIELSNMIFDNGEYSVKYSHDFWDKVYERLKKGEIDTCGLLSVSEDRKKDILYSDPVLTTHFSLYTRKQHGKISLENLHRYKIGVVKGYYTEKLLREQLKIDKYITYQNFDNCILALSDGDVDVVFANQEVFNYLLIKKDMSGQIVPQLTELFIVDFAYGVRKGNEPLVSYINKKIAEVRKSGAYEGVYQKYFFKHSDYYTENQKEKSIKIAVLILVLIIVMIMLLQLYIRFLKNRISKVNEQLFKEHEWLSITLSSIGDAVIASDEKGIINFVNQTALSLTGYEEEQVIGARITDILDIVFTKEATSVSSLEELLKEHVSCQFIDNLKLKLKDGSEHWISINASPIKSDTGMNIGTVMVIRDISEKKADEEKINNLAYYDTLTGLPNRAMFMDRLSEALIRSLKNGSSGVLMFLDIDNFKTVNDTLGHIFGDVLLKNIAAMLVEKFGDSVFMARLGGDEFIVMKEDIRNVEEAVGIAEGILGNFRQNWLVQDREFFITTSIGVTVFPKDGSDELTLLKNADTAMYHAKEYGKNNYKIYNENMNAAVMERIEMENYLRHAINKKEFTIYYQPQIDIRSGKIIGAEALIRWIHPMKGLIPPSRFIPLAEESGLIVPIGEWVLSNACRQWKKWVKEGFAPMMIAVNLSARQFDEENLIERIESIINETGMDPCYLDLEITESITIHDLDYSIEVLKKLKDMGIRISLDDFGKGYSSLNYLRQLPINTLKIDKTFIDDIAVKTNETAIVKAMISMAHSMNLTVTAEGVETEEQLHFLQTQQCDKVQGYLFSKPLEVGDFELLLKEDKISRGKG